MLDEFGCAEAGRFTSSDTTQELLESRLKCPKVLRDMFYKLSVNNPSRHHEMLTVGFIVMGKKVCFPKSIIPPFTVVFPAAGLKITFVTMDCPAGYVCRLLRLSPLKYPDRDANFVAMIPLIETIWKIKELMLQRPSRIYEHEDFFFPTFKRPALNSRFTTIIYT